MGAAWTEPALEWNTGTGPGGAGERSTGPNRWCVLRPVFRRHAGWVTVTDTCGCWDFGSMVGWVSGLRTSGAQGCVGHTDAQHPPPLPLSCSERLRAGEHRAGRPSPAGGCSRRGQAIHQGPCRTDSAPSSPPHGGNPRKAGGAQGLCVARNSQLVPGGCGLRPASMESFRWVSLMGRFGVLSGFVQPWPSCSSSLERPGRWREHRETWVSRSR